MEPFAYYSNSGASWSSDEDGKLIQEYNKDEYDIMRIGHIHKRTPGGIACRLQKLLVIGATITARGYTEYRLSPLYNEIVNNSKKSRKEKINDPVSEPEVKTRSRDRFRDNLSEISIIKNDISEINKKIDKILNYMTALYDFETG